MNGRLELSLLGSPIVRLGDTPVTGFRSSKAAALLYYLAVTRRSHSRPALAGIFWGDSVEELARRSLRSALFNLRQLVGSHLVITAHDVLFAHTSPYRLDVEIFEATTQPLTAQGDTEELDIEELDVEQLQQALGLYRGDFLEGFYVHNAPEFEQWVLAQRQRLRERVVTTYQALANRYEGAGAWSQAIECARRLLALEPWHEEVHRQLMLLLAHNGQRSAALAQYELCCRVLAAELDVEADNATQELYERIRSGALAPAVTLPNALVPSKHNLPAQIIPFVGRTSELTLLTQLLDQPSTRLVTILGLGGMGKTRMGLEVAATQVDRRRHGVYYVPLAPLDDAHSLIQTIAGVVHCSFQADRRSPRQQLFDYLSHKEMLLLLDNFEHLADGAELLHELLQAAPGIRLLVTSRERLRLSGETIFRLEGLELSTPPTIEPGAIEQGAIEPHTTEMAGSAAAQLFLQSVQRIRPEFMPGAEEWQAIDEVCRLVQGMPLGIVLAAAWSTTLSPTEIAAEIRHGLGFLESDLRDLPVRQRSMSAILTQTWARLDESEVTAFRRMAVFRGGFSRQAGQAVTGATLAMLATLLDKALLARNVKGRYDIHELLRQSAQQRLEAAGEIKQTCDAHSAYYLSMLHQYESDLKGGRQATALQELDDESDNIRAAWQWAFNHDQLERLAPAVEVLGRFYAARGRFREGEIAFRQLAEKLSSVPEERHSLAKALVWQAEFSHTLGRTDEAIRLLRQSLALLEGLATEGEAGEAGEAGEEVRPTKAAALSRLGLYLYFSDGAQGQRYLEESLALCRATGDSLATAKVLHMLANFDVMSGALVEAKQKSKDSKESCQMLGNYAEMLEALLNLTEISIKLGDFDNAEHFAQEYYAAGEKIGHQEPIVYTPWVRGQACLFAGNFGEGQLLLEESLTMTQERGDFYHLSRVRLELAEVNVHLGAYTEAEALAESALHMADENDLTSRCGDALCRLGEIRLAEKANQEALRLLGEAATIYRAIQQLTKLATVQAMSGCAAYAAGNLPLARRYLLEALQMAAGWPDWSVGIQILALAVPLLAEHGELECAVEVYTVAKRYPYIANSRWYQQLVDQPLAAKTAALAEDVRQESQERGQSRPWQGAVADVLTIFVAINAQPGDNPDATLPALHAPTII